MREISWKECNVQLGVIGVEMVINTTVRVNDSADWVSVERKKNWTKDGALADPILVGNRM